MAAAVAAKSVEEIYTKNEYRIPVRDGVLLYTAVYAPCDGAKAPMIIFRTPYGCAPYGTDKFPAKLSKGYFRSYIDRGYIVVMQDVRGRFMSEGEFVNVRPAGFGEVDETTDSYDTVDWLVKHVPGNNGRVGFAGCSYPGFYAMMGALCGHPAVKAVSPQAPVTDWYMGDDTHHNGVLMLTDSYGFIAGMSHAGEHRPAVRMPAKKKIDRSPDEYAFFLRCGTLDSMSRMLDPTPFWEEMAAHPDYDEWWQERDVRRACYNVKPALLIVGGTFDAEDCFGTWNLYRAIRRQSPTTDCRLVVGPWAHGAWLGGGRTLGAFDFGEQAAGEYYMENFEMPFFDRYLWGAEADSVPAVSVFSSGDNRWHTLQAWPARNSKKVTFYLKGKGNLDTRKPEDKNSYSSYTSDPQNPVPYNKPLGEFRVKEYMLADQRFASKRSDVLTFMTEPLAADMTLAGPVAVKLETAISTTDADFVVKIIDVFPGDDPKEQYQMLVRGDVMRGRYRRSFSRPVPFRPGEPERVEFTMADIVHTFRAGHRIQVQVQSSWFPLAERSPQQCIDTWHCTERDFVPCEVKVFHQRDRASSVTLQVLGE